MVSMPTSHIGCDAHWRTLYDCLKQYGINVAPMLRKSHVKYFAAVSYTEDITSSPINKGKLYLQSKDRQVEINDFPGSRKS